MFKLKMRPITQFLTAVLMLIASVAIAQPMILKFEVVPQPGQPPYPIGSHIVVKLRVTNLTNMEGYGFPIIYNKAALKFDSINEINVPDFYAGSNYNSVPAQGKIAVQWNAPLNSQTGTLNVATVPANTSMFTMHFTAIGNGSSTMTLSPTTSPQIEAVRANQGAVLIDYSNGAVTIPIGDGSVPPPSYTGFKIIANNFYLPPGTRGCMPVKVNDFDNIIAFQYVMHWNPAVLEFDCTRNVTIGNTAQNNNIAFSTNPTTGTQIVNWDDPTFAGVTKPDLSNIYEVCFKGIGTVNQFSEITFDGTGLPPSTGGAAASNPSGTNLWTPAIADTAFIRSVACPANAVVFTADKDSLPTENGCIDVKVQTFVNVTDVDFVMTYDNTKLTLTTPITVGGPLATTAANFNTTTPGQIRFRWGNANGITVANGTSIISPCFTTTQTTGKYDVKFETPACLGTMVHRKNIVGVPYCFENGFIELTGSPAPTLSKTDPNCTSPNSGTITTTLPAGYAASAYAWTAPASAIQNPTGLPAGTYTVTVTYTNGTTATSSTTLSMPPAVSLPTPTTVASTCFGTNTGTATASPTGGTGAYSYIWNNNGITATITGLAAGVYNVTVKDANQCTATGSATVGGPAGPITLPTANISTTNPTCSNGTNGSITVAATGGNAGAYTYKWNNNATTATISNLGAGQYTLTITDSKGCMQPIGTPITLVAPSAITIPTPTVTDVTCKGSNTGKVLISPSGGTPSPGGSPYTIVWKNTATGAVVNPNAVPAGTYAATVSDQNGCTATTTQTATVLEPTTAFAVTTGTITPSGCGNTGAISLTPSGGWGTYSITWTPAIPGNFNPTNIPAGTYTYIAKDKATGGCEITNNVVVPGNPPITATVAKTDVACFGDATGGIVLTISGGSGSGYSVAWNPPAPSSGTAISGLVAGTYTPTVTDGLGCTMILSSITIAGPTAPIVLQDTNIVKQTVSALGSIDLVSIVGGTPFGGGTYHYLWSSGETTQNISGKQSGNYTVTISDANGCNLIVELYLGKDNVVDGTTCVAAPACSDEGSISINIPATTVGPFNIAWSGTETGSLMTANNPANISSLSAGPYSVTVTHVTTGNSTTCVVNVAQLAIPTYTTFKNDPFADQPTGVITVTPTSSSLNYHWNNGQTVGTLFSLVAGTYTVTITNPLSGCTAVETFNLVAQWPVPTLNTTATQPTCLGTATGQICAVGGGGNPSSYTYKWSNGQTGACINNLTAGTYTVTFTEGNGTTTTKTEVLSNQSNLKIDVVNEISLYPGNTQVSSADVCDGKAIVVYSGASGAVGIVWSNNITTANNNSLCGGAYSVTVTDVVGCTSVWTDSLKAPAAISITSEITAPIKCNSNCNATARVRVQGGIEPYEISWSTGQFDPQVFITGYSEETALCAGTYSVTITDGNGTSKVRQIVVDEPAPLVVNLDVPAGLPSSFSACDAQMIATAIGASSSGPITYEWTSLNRIGKFGNKQTADALCAGDVIQFMIKDANGCEASAIDTVPYPEDGCLQGRPVMTPNDDNLNDWFEITCITDYTNTVDIFNRWGQLVYSVEGYDNANAGKRWNGTSRNGQPLAEGVYFYVLNLKDDNGNVSQKKGYVNLLR